MYTRWCRQPRKKEKKNIPPSPPFSFIFLEAIGAPPLARNIFSFIFFSFLGTLMMTRALGCSQSNAKSGASGFAWHFILPSRRRCRRRLLLSLSIHLAVAGRRLLLLFVLSSTTPDIFKKKIHNSGYIFIHQFFQPPPKKCLPVISDYSIQQKTTTTLFFSVVSTGQIDV
jgi:hypothetical protein